MKLPPVTIAAPPVLVEVDGVVVVAPVVKTEVVLEAEPLTDAVADGVAERMLEGMVTP